MGLNYNHLFDVAFFNTEYWLHKALKVGSMIYKQIFLFLK